MTPYAAPLRDMQFVLKELAGLEEIAKLPGCEEAKLDLVDSILDEAAKFAGAYTILPANIVASNRSADSADNPNLSKSSWIIPSWIKAVINTDSPRYSGSRDMDFDVRSMVIYLWARSTGSFSSAWAAPHGKHARQADLQASRIGATTELMLIGATEVVLSTVIFAGSSFG